jgi:hypothetical protein
MSWVDDVAPAIAVQARNSALHRAHWKLNDDGFGCQLPGATRTVVPSTTLPETFGLTFDRSCGGAPAIGPARLANAVAVPVSSVARTATLSV